uniref:Peroxisomal membrane protein 11C n=1 Tax=Chlamydomonas euryale TaxID=1486919 RepID=A0A7R9VW38_9CHLO|mmetsp:Transcript_45539/g.135823  ORF Transcript_45539/g.135823 Transcript_45539/m.135823 type:complete len:237 (+) Transcript_45539:241-951(+)
MATVTPQFTTRQHLQVLNGFLAKSDGKDKLTALIQYACLFLSAGEPGSIKKVQASVTAARKVFRVMRPLEAIMPIINQPGFTGNSPKLVQAVNKLKSALMAIYFGADHFVWAYQIGLISDKTTGERMQKLSLWAWALGSVATIGVEAYNIAATQVVQGKDESDESYNMRVDEARKAINQKMLVLVHACFQAALAGGLLQVVPFKPRTVGLIGCIASAMNCYFLLPAYPAQAKAKTA